MKREGDEKKKVASYENVEEKDAGKRGRLPETMMMQQMMRFRVPSFLSKASVYLSSYSMTVCLMMFSS